MSLGRYEAKRNFQRSAEPRGHPRKRTGRKGPSFVVQKHAARRLHYDLRLELDGVLKSWAVTRGPSLVPGDRRLAVEVEDHPLDYAEFEGTIPKGEYGGGRVLVWDRGQWTPRGDAHAALRKGHLRFTLDGSKLSGAFDLVRLPHEQGDRHNNWLLVKVKDEHARAPRDPDILVERPESVKSGKTIDAIKEPKEEEKTPGATRGATAKVDRARRSAAQRPAAGNKTPRATAAANAATKTARADRPATAAPTNPPRASGSPASRTAAKRVPGASPATLPSFVEFALAVPVAQAPRQRGWIHEIKFDGYRLQARIDHGRVTLRTRTGLDWTSKFATVARALREIDVERALFDGEVVAEAAEGVSSFSALQTELKDGRGERLVYYVFDLLYIDGYDLRGAALSDRKTLLAELISPDTSGFVRLSETFDMDGETLKKHACRVGFEGIVSKRAEARYSSGRSGEWLKIKCTNRQEFVVVGYVPSTTARRAIGSLALGVYDDGRLTFAGKVGSGFATKLAEDLWSELEPLRRAEPTADAAPDADTRNVRWVEPTLVAEVTFREWTPSGVIRQAVFNGLRRDKAPREVVREEALPLNEARPARSSRPAAQSAREIEEPAIKLTHPDRLYWSEAGISKQGLADYYSAIWEWVAPHVTGRPLALVRCPGGIEGQCFFQKHAWTGLDRKQIEVARIGGEEVLSIRSPAGALALVQAGTLEIHPWGSTVKNPECPDRLIFDLDPGDGVSWAEVEDAALTLRDRLRRLGLECFVKTTGGKGLHVVVPVAAVTPWAQAKKFTHGIATGLAREAPDRYIARMTKAARGGKIFIDYLRNGRGATAVAAYSPRARPGAPVSVPLSWDELGTGLSPARFTVNTVPRRLQALEHDPWRDLGRMRQPIPDG